MLFNCAGIVASGTILETTRLDCDRLLAVNVIALVEVTRAVLPAMLEAGSGVIENMASGVSSVKAYTSCFAYGASKAAAIKQGVNACFLSAGTDIFSMLASVHTNLDHVGSAKPAESY